MAFLPNKPLIQVDANDWVMKEWFDSVYRQMRGNDSVAPVQTVSFIPTFDFWLWPCDTTAGNIIVTLPPAKDIIGKKFVFQKTVAANVLTVNAAAGDTINGFAGFVVALNQSLMVVSDGNVLWYKILTI
jgi:hypothetical protein